MEFFSVTDYRKAIRYLIERDHARGLKTNLSRLAEAIRVQRPYLTKVMSGDAEFNSDQLFLIGEFFGLNPAEADYLGLLLEYSRTQLKTKKDLLKRQIQKTQAQNLELKRHVDAEVMATEPDPLSRYYLDPYVLLVHVAMNVPRFQNLDALARALSLSKDQLVEIIKALEAMGLLQFKGGKYIVSFRKMHLPKESHLLRPYQALVRLQSLQQQRSSRNPGNFTFNVAFSADEPARARIQEAFLDFLKKTQKIVAQSEQEQVYQLNFDLFSWTD